MGADPVKCAACGRLAAATMAACPFCGAALQVAALKRAPVKCAGCGRLHAAQMSACPFCGAMHTPEASPAPLERAAAPTPFTTRAPRPEPVETEPEPYEIAVLDTPLDRWLIVLGYPFELVVHAMVRMRGKGWGMLLLLVMGLGLGLGLMRSVLYDEPLWAWGVGGVVAAAVLVVARAHVGLFPLGSMQVGFGWKLVLYLPAAAILAIGLPTTVSSALSERGFEAMILGREITYWVVTSLLVVSAGAALARAIRLR